MSACHYEQFDEKSARITGARWIPSDEVLVKIEGARKVGERYMGIGAIRDRYIIKHVDQVVQWSRDSVSNLFGRDGYELFFHIFGKNGVLKELEPVERNSGT